MTIKALLPMLGMYCFFVSGCLYSDFMAEGNRSALQLGTDLRGNSSSACRWQLRSKHIVHGVPALVDDRYARLPGGPGVGVSVLVREGFVIGHFDRGKLPLWMSMRWTKADLLASVEAEERQRQFDADDELSRQARGTTDYETAGLDRGHLARNIDNLAWGEDNARMGDLMSNVVPLPAALNRGPWLELEKVVSSAPEKKLALSDTFWIVAGPIFEAGEVKRRTGNGIAVPDAFFKIVAWVDRSSKFQAMAFIFPKDAVFRDPSIYLSSVNEVEVRTGIDFFHELDEDAEDDAEAFVPNCMWEMSR